MKDRPKTRRNLLFLSVWDRPLIKYPVIIFTLIEIYDTIVSQLLPTEWANSMPTVFEMFSEVLNVSFPWWFWYPFVGVAVFLAAFEFVFQYWKKDGAVESLVHLSEIRANLKDLEEKGQIRFFLRGYNATKFELKFKLKGGNLTYERAKDEVIKLPLPSLEFPWKNPAHPYEEFGIRIIQPIPKQALNEIKTALEGKGTNDFSFGDLEIYAQAENKKKIQIPLNFKRHNWTDIRLIRQGDGVRVSKVIHLFIKPIVLGKTRLGEGKL